MRFKRYSSNPPLMINDIPNTYQAWVSLIHKDDIHVEPYKVPSKGLQPLFNLIFGIAVFFLGLAMIDKGWDYVGTQLKIPEIRS